MTISKLKRFGLLQKTFKGRGIIKFHDGTEASASFTLAQLTVLDLVFVAYIDLPAWEYDKHESQAFSLFGKLSDGREASVNGLYVKYIESNSSLTKTYLIGYASNFIFGIAEFQKKTSVSFELTNFLFSHPSVFSLQLGNRNVALSHIDDYEAVEVELRAQKRVKVTCTATTEVESSSEVEEVVKMIDDLCDVMTVARSTLISWTSYEVVTQDGQSLFSTYRNSVIRNYAGSPIIINTDIKNTKIFLEKAFLHYEALSKQYNVRQLARAYTETRSGGFIESRSMLTGVLLEYITSIQARLDNRSSFLPAQTYEAHLSEFSSGAKDLLLSTYPEVKSKYLSTMINIIRGFNRRPFSWKLNSLVKKLSITVEHGEIEKIVATRNNLAHNGKFSEDESPTIQYLRMQHFVDRVMLRLFGYHGLYYDLKHNKSDEI